MTASPCPLSTPAAPPDNFEGISEDGSVVQQSALFPLSFLPLLPADLLPCTALPSLNLHRHRSLTPTSPA